MAVSDGRGLPIEPVPDSRPSALSLASDVYGRLACGRLDPDEAVVTGVVAIEGDIDLGGALVHQFNYMF